MPDFEHRENSGSMFVNQRKTRDNHPDRTGSCLIDGIKYRVSGWVKPGRDGKDAWLSLAFTPEDEGQERSGPRTDSGERPAPMRTEAPTRRDPPQGGFDSMEDDIPF